MNVLAKSLYKITLLTSVFIIQLLGVDTVRGATCSTPHIFNLYMEGMRYVSSGNFSDAFIKFQPLAEAGFGPAQREISKIFARGGPGIPRSAIRAAIWSELAFRSGDKEGNKLSRIHRLALTPDQLREVNAKLGAWSAKALGCMDGRVVRYGKTRSVDTPLSVEIDFNKRIKPEGRSAFETKINALLITAVRSQPFARIYLGIIDKIEVYKGNRYHRYLGWRQKSKKNILRFASSNLEDLKPHIIARALVIEAQRRAYLLLPGADFVDPLLREFNGIKIYGSVYPDIANERFFNLMRDAFMVIKRLPKELRVNVEAIDEIHYNPHSKHFLKYGVTDSSGAYYNKFLSSASLTMIFVRRDALYSSPFFLVRTLVHEGTHALQDQKAKLNLVKIRELKRDLIKLERSQKESTRRYATLKSEIDKKLNYAIRWFRGIETKSGTRVQDIEFECEATINEIKALRALGASPRAMSDSGYVRVCPLAEGLINSWKSEKGGKRK